MKLKVRIAVVDHELGRFRRQPFGIPFENHIVLIGFSELIEKQRGIRKIAVHVIPAERQLMIDDAAGFRDLMDRFHGQILVNHVLGGAEIRD